MRIDEIPEIGARERWLYLFGGRWHWDIGPFRLRKTFVSYGNNSLELSDPKEWVYDLEFAHRDDQGLSKPALTGLSGREIEAFPEQSLRLSEDEFANTFNTLHADQEEDNRYRVWVCDRKERTPEQKEIVRHCYGQMIGITIPWLVMIRGLQLHDESDILLFAGVLFAVTCGMLWNIMRKNLQLLACSHFESLKFDVEERRRIANLPSSD